MSSIESVSRAPIGTNVEQTIANDINANVQVTSVSNDGHMVCHTGALIANRYRIVENLGKGHFARVVRVIDIRTDRDFALKIYRNKTKYRKNAKDEIAVMRYIARRDPTGKSLCSKILKSFEFNGHICIAFEMLGSDVYDFLERNDFHPFQLNQLCHIAYQLCYSLNYWHQRGIIHTDVKTDNIVFVDSRYTKIYNAEKKTNIRLVNRTDVRLIDFGCAIDDDVPHTFTVSNRLYRAPEVVMNSYWSHPIDVWSLGCVLYELYTGNIIFNTYDGNNDDADLEHLAIMEKVLGPIPESVAAANPHYFTNGKLNFDWSKKPAEENCHQPLRTSMKSTGDDDRRFFDLMEQMLTYEPSERITMKAALQHPFFNALPFHQRLG